MQRNYFYLPPPQYQLYSEVKVARASKQLIGLRREDDGEISYRLNTGRFVSEKIVKSALPISYVGLIWHLDVHFPKHTYHVENVIVDQSFRPLKISNINFNAWDDHSDYFKEWTYSCLPADVTLTVRNSQGYLIDAWHLYDVFCVIEEDKYGVCEVDLEFSSFIASKVKHEGFIHYEIGFRDCSVLARFNCGIPIQVRKYLPGFEKANEAIMQMRHRYENNIKLFLLDAAIQNEKEILPTYNL